MLQQCENNPLVRPDVVTFSALLDGWANVADVWPKDALGAAHQILWQMQELEWPKVQPNERTYISVLSILARSRLWEVGPQAEFMIQQMKAIGIEPSIIH